MQVEFQSFLLILNRVILYTPGVYDCPAPPPPIPLPTLETDKLGEK